MDNNTTPVYSLEAARDYAQRHDASVQGGDKAAFHVSSPVGWINDPNGFSVYQGQIHLFFQHHPYDAQWGPMHWGHVVTDDLVRWRLLPEALAPDQPYETGCFSGSAVQAGDQQALIYTSHHEVVQEDGLHRVRQTQSVAFGNGINYTKYEDNPVIGTKGLPPRASKADFRDPKVWAENGVYRMVVGSRSEDHSGQILLYESPDLIHWSFVCVVDRSHNRLGKMWECPDFFPLDGRQVLLVSPQEMRPDDRGEFHGKNGTVCIVGDWDEDAKQFTRRTVGCVDYGWDFYAPQTTLLPDGRRVMIAWMQSWDNNVTPPEQTWTGMMTFPRELRIVNDRLVQLPVKEIEHYYTNRRFVKGVTDSGRRQLAFGRQLDFTLTVTNAREAVFNLDVAANEKYSTRITYNAPARRLIIDRTNAGMVCDRIPVHVVPLREMKDTVKLRVLLDTWSMELFLNDGEQAVTTLLYTPQGAQDVLLRAPKPIRYTFESHEIDMMEDDGE